MFAWRRWATNTSILEICIASSVESLNDQQMKSPHYAFRCICLYTRWSYLLTTSSSVAPLVKYTIWWPFSANAIRHHIAGLHSGDFAAIHIFYDCAVMRNINSNYFCVWIFLVLFNLIFTYRVSQKPWVTGHETDFAFKMSVPMILWDFIPHTNKNNFYFLSEQKKSFIAVSLNFCNPTAYIATGFPRSANSAGGCIQSQRKIQLVVTK